MVFTVFRIWQVCYRILISKYILSGVPEHAATRHYDSFRHLPATSHKGVWPRIKKSYGTQEMFPLGSPSPTYSFQFPPPLSAPSRDRTICKSADPAYPVRNALNEELSTVTQKQTWPRKKFAKNRGTDVFALCSFAKLYNQKIRTMKRNFNVFAIHNAPSRSIISKNNYTAAL